MSSLSPGVDNAFTKTLRGIVAIDDVWGLITFSMVVVFVQQLNGHEDAAILAGMGYELFGSRPAGCVDWLSPPAFFTGRHQRR